MDYEIKRVQLLSLQTLKLSSNRPFINVVTMKKLGYLVMEKKIPVWILVLVIFLGLNGTVLFGWAVRNVSLGDKKLGKLGSVVIKIASFPSLVEKAFLEVAGISPLLINNRFPEIDGFKKNGVLQEGAVRDDGYLLLSAYNNSKVQSTVKLIRISDQQVLHEWVPNIQELADSQNTHSNRMRPSRYRIKHPLLLADGGILFQHQGPTFKINACSNIEWGIKGHFHHSIEEDSDGNFWVPSVKSTSHKFMGVYYNDAIAKMSPDGKLLFKKSVTEILEKNGYRGLLFGAGSYGADAIHLNDIQPAHYSTEYWEKGDLLVSMRNRSAIFLYRPSTDKIIWLKTGQWINQHDLDYIGQSKILLFGNDMVRGGKMTKKHLIDGHNNIYLLDLADGSVSTPYSKVLKEFEVRTITGGLQERLENGDVFVEETNYGRILRISPTQVIWEFTVKVDNDITGLLNWSRYLTKEQVKDILPVLEGANCS